MISDIAQKALEFVRDHEDCYAWEVAQHLWPDHPMLGRPAGDRGGGNAGAIVAAGYMGRLRKRGLTEGYSGMYRLTRLGRKELAAKITGQNDVKRK